MKKPVLPPSSPNPGRPLDADDLRGVTGGEVVSPRDVATGQSSGKRQHEPINN
jgi:hypothetical protein